MNKLMRRLLIVAMLANVAGPATAALTKFQGDATDGATSVVSSLFGSTTKALKSCPGATIRMYVTGTSTLATLYDASSVSIGTSATASSNGRFSFYINDGTYDVRVSGGGCSDHTWVAVVVGSGINASNLVGVDLASYATRGDGAVEILTGTGTISVTNGSTTVNGIGTAFTTQLAVGDIIKANGVDDFTVDSITSDTLLTIQKNFSSTTGTYAFTFRKPWSGWEVAPCVSYTACYFRAGRFTTPLFNMDGYKQFRLYGAGPGVSVVYGTGTGNVIQTGAVSPTTFGVIIDNLWVRSDGDATNGIYWKSVHHSTLRNVKLTDVTNAAFYQEFGVANQFYDIRITGNEGDQVVKPAYGMFFTRLGAAENSTQATMVGGHIDQTTNAGIYFDYMSGAKFYAVTSEGNTNRALYVSANSNRNVFDGLHVEENGDSNPDIEVIDGSYGNEFRGIYCGSTTVPPACTMTLDGTRHRVIGSSIDKLNVNGDYCSIQDVMYSLTGSGGFTDSGTGTVTEGLAVASGQVAIQSRHNRSWVSRTANGNDGASFDPGYTEFQHQRFNLIGTTPQNLSSTVYPTGKPWRVLFIGYFADVSIGPTLAMQTFIREVTSANPSFVVGNRTVTVSQTGGGVFQIAADAIYCGFAGTVHIVVGNYATGLSTTSIVLQGNIDAGGIGRHMTGSWYQVTTVAASQTDVALTSGSYPRGWIATRAGSVTAVVINLASARTAGTLTVRVQKSTDSGTTWANITNCEASITTNVTKGLATFTRGTYTFAANDMLRAVVWTGAGWTPTANTLDSSIEVEIP